MGWDGAMWCGVWVGRGGDLLLGPRGCDVFFLLIVDYCGRGGGGRAVASFLFGP